MCIQEQDADARRRGGFTVLLFSQWKCVTFRGEVTDAFEATPHSAGYYHATATYWANGLLNNLQTGVTGFPGWTYAADGEGRINSVTAWGGQSPADEYGVGAPLALAAGHLPGNQLYGVDPNHSAAPLGAAAILGACALVASLVPAFRATFVSSLEALKAE